MRKLLCERCISTSGQGYLREPGWEKRVVHGTALKREPDPKQPNPLPLKCDDCGRDLNEGAKCTALSMWREGEMPAWEDRFLVRSSSTTESDKITIGVDHGESNEPDAATGSGSPQAGGS